jgi:sulfur carrier protein ThiS
VRVIAHLHTILQRQTPEGLVDRLEVDLSDNNRVADLLSLLEISLPVDALLLAVNGRVADVEQILQDGDQVNIMPAISGGLRGLGS